MNEFDKLEKEINSIKDKKVRIVMKTKLLEYYNNELNKLPKLRKELLYREHCIKTNKRKIKYLQQCIIYQEEKIKKYYE